MINYVPMHFWGVLRSNVVLAVFPTPLSKLVMTPHLYCKNANSGSYKPVKHLIAPQSTWLVQQHSNSAQDAHWSLLFHPKNVLLNLHVIRFKLTLLGILVYAIKSIQTGVVIQTVGERPSYASPIPLWQPWQYLTDFTPLTLPLSPSADGGEMTRELDRRFRSFENLTGFCWPWLCAFPPIVVS